MLTGEPQKTDLVVVLNILLSLELTIPVQSVARHLNEWTVAANLLSDLRDR